MNRSTRRLLPVVLLAVVALVAGACGDDDDDEGTASATPEGPTAAKGEITIGAFNFSESAILAHIYAGALEEAGYTVEVRENLGNRELVAPALERGEIDMYPGYAATELEFFNSGAGQATPDAEETTEKLRTLLATKQLTALQPSPAIDANAFAVTKATADRLKLTKLSDLAPVAGDLTLGGPPECPQRPFCQVGLEQTYGLRFKSFKALDAGGPLSKTALENGDVDVALIFSSDGAIVARNFVVLEDDKNLQNADNVVPVLRTQVATDEVEEILDGISADLTTEDLTELNKRADVDKEDPDALAEEWLEDH
ncbi:MAG: ABC transporter substrate-binding protein [Acidimicrobiales bacterium]